MVVEIMKDLSIGTEYKVLHIEYGDDSNLYLLRDLKEKGTIYCHHDADKNLRLVPLTQDCIFKKEKIINSVGRTIFEYTIRGIQKVYKRAP